MYNVLTQEVKCCLVGQIGLVKLTTVRHIVLSLYEEQVEVVHFDVCHRDVIQSGFNDSVVDDDGASFLVVYNQRSNDGESLAVLNGARHNASDVLSHVYVTFWDGSENRQNRCIWQGYACNTIHA